MKATVEQPMIRYRVLVSGFTPDSCRRFLNWMQTEHSDDMLSVAGCLECRVFAENTPGDGRDAGPMTSLCCEYLFRSQTDLDAYLRDGAEAMRAKGLNLFAGDGLIFNRSVHELRLHRTPAD